MIDLTPEKLESIVKALATLRRAAALEVDSESTIAGRQMLAAAFVVGGSNLMLMQSVREITNELRDLMHSKRAANTG